MMPFGLMMFIVMFPFKCLTDKYSRQIRKDESLNESHQDFNEIDEHSEQD